MKKLLLCDNIYNDIDKLSDLITNLEYVDTIHGKEIENFNYLPNGLSEFFCMVLQESIELQGGQFRKPNSLIYFDNFYEHTLWLCVVAIEETELTLYEHELGYQSFFDIPKDTNMDQFFTDNCNDSNKWKVKSIINIPKNGFVFVRPWLWKSLKEDKLIQVFILNHKIQQQEQ